MPEKKSEKREENKKIVMDRRNGKERRTGKLADKFKYSVEIGFFLDARKGERRKKSDDHIVSYN